ncbi:L-lactate permease [Phenylobacterium sp. LjRoot219]|uniref:L-lactate permease n=1 Tax=Phenylobacterium sp. LjRoot219 TaxID=3342283 RepID=UPI003ECE239D
MFHQPLQPVGDSLWLSFLVASIPIAVVLVLLGVVRRPAWQASLAALIVAFTIATMVWRMPTSLAFSSMAAGATFALWPVMWIVFNGLILYNVTVASGRFDAFRTWMVEHLPNDRRVVLVVVGFCFGCLLEGVAGYGLPVAITSSLLIALGFPPIQALVVTLIFNTAPVAFGGLGVPVTTLSAVTQLPATSLAAMIGRQLPLLAILLPFYAIATQEGARALRGVWPVLLVAGTSFAVGQFVASNYLSYELTDLVSSLTALIATVTFLRVWKYAPDERYALPPLPQAPRPAQQLAAWEGWVPWLLMVTVVIAWVHLKLNLLGEIKVAWPSLHREVFITAYNKPYDAIWSFQPLSTGTAITVASVLVAAVVRLSPARYFRAVVKAALQIRMPALTTTLIVALAYLMNYSGLTYTLGIGAATAGPLFPLLAAFLGWLAVFLSGSDTSGNALFGNLQVVAANRLGLDPVLMAATNSSGGVLGKMISPQNITTGAVMTGMQGREGEVLARTFKHSVILTLLLGLLVMAQQYLFPGVIPH